MMSTILPGVGRTFGRASRAATNAVGAAGNFAGGIVDGVSDGFRTPKPEKGASLNPDGQKSTAGHDFDVNKQDKQNQNPVGFGDADAKDPVVGQTNQDQNDASNSESPISGNPKNPFMDDYQGPNENPDSGLISKEVNDQNKEENNQPRKPLGNPHSKAYKVGNFVANALSGKEAANLMFPTKAKSDVSGGVNREDMQKKAPTNTSNNSSYANNNKKQSPSSSSFFEEPTQRQLNAAARMGIQNASNMNRGQLSQALEVAGMDKSYWERKNE